MNIFSLNESFNVILEKLDNVDEQTIRYKRETMESSKTLKTIYYH